MTNNDINTNNCNDTVSHEGNAHNNIEKLTDLQSQNEKQEHRTGNYFCI